MDLSKGVEDEEIRVARNQVCRIATDREFEEFVVLRIATGRDLYNHLDPLSLARERRQKIPDILLLQIATEGFSVKDIVEFRQYGKREQDSAG